MLLVIKTPAMITLDQVSAKDLCAALGDVPQGSPVAGQDVPAIQISMSSPYRMKISANSGMALNELVVKQQIA